MTTILFALLIIVSTATFGLTIYAVVLYRRLASRIRSRQVRKQHDERDGSSDKMTASLEQPHEVIAELREQVQRQMLWATRKPYSPIPVDIYEHVLATYRSYINATVAGIPPNLDRDLMHRRVTGVVYTAGTQVVPSEDKPRAGQPEIVPFARVRAMLEKHSLSDPVDEDEDLAVLTRRGSWMAFAGRHRNP